VAAGQKVNIGGTVVFKTFDVPPGAHLTIGTPITLPHVIVPKGTTVTVHGTAVTTPPDDRQALRAALAALKDVPAVLSANGHVSFSANREANLAPTVRIVRHGHFVRFP
jgi:hypothetical protein